MSGQLPGAGGSSLPVAPRAGAGPALGPRQFSARWTPAEIQALRAAWPDPEIAKADIPGIVGRTLKACDEMARILGLGKRPVAALSPMAWRPADDAFLRRHWHSHGRQYIAAQLEKSERAVSHRANRLGLGRSEFERAKLAARAAAMISGVQKQRTIWLKRTDERAALLRQLWPTETPVDDIRDQMNRLPGVPMDVTAVRNWAGDLKLRRPPGFTGQAAARRDADFVFEAPPPVQIIPRKCLCCGVGFEARGRFIRMCNRCKGHRE